MIKLRYAILGSIIPMLVVAYYADDNINSLHDNINTLNKEIKVLKQNGYCECL